MIAQAPLAPLPSRRGSRSKDSAFSGSWPSRFNPPARELWSVVVWDEIGW